MVDEEGRGGCELLVDMCRTATRAQESPPDGERRRCSRAAEPPGGMESENALFQIVLDQDVDQPDSFCPRIGREGAV
jgi:hypothetical protein